MVRNHPIIAALVIAFAAYYLFTQPEQAAGVTAWAWNGVGDAFGSVKVYLQTLFS